MISDVERECATAGLRLGQSAIRKWDASLRPVRAANGMRLYSPDIVAEFIRARRLALAERDVRRAATAAAKLKTSPCAQRGALTMQ